MQKVASASGRGAVPPPLRGLGNNANDSTTAPLTELSPTLATARPSSRSTATTEGSLRGLAVASPLASSIRGASNSTRGGNGNAQATVAGNPNVANSGNNAAASSALTPTAAPLISYASFVRREAASRSREALDLSRDRRGSGCLSSALSGAAAFATPNRGVGNAGRSPAPTSPQGQGYPVIVGGPSLGPSPSTLALRTDEELLSTFLPSISTGTATPLRPSGPSTSAARSLTAVPMSAAAGGGVTPNKLLEGRSQSAVPLQMGGDASAAQAMSTSPQSMRPTFLTDTYELQRPSASSSAAVSASAAVSRTSSSAKQQRGYKVHLPPSPYRAVRASSAAAAASIANASSLSTPSPIAGSGAVAAGSSSNGSSLNGSLGRGISALAAYQNEADGRLLAALFGETPTDTARRLRHGGYEAGYSSTAKDNSSVAVGGKGRTNGPAASDYQQRRTASANVPTSSSSKASVVAGTSSEEGDGDPLDEALRRLAEFVSALREAERAADRGAGRGDPSADGEDCGGGGNSGGPSGAGKEGSGAKGKGRRGILGGTLGKQQQGGTTSSPSSVAVAQRSKLGPLHTIAFGSDAAIAERLKELLALEGLDAETFLQSSSDAPRGSSSHSLAAKKGPHTNSNNNTNHKGSGDLCPSAVLDRLSAATLAEEQAAAYAQINARYERDEAARREAQRRARARSAAAESGATALMRRAGPQGPANAFALLNEIRRREQQNAAAVGGGGGADGAGGGVGGSGGEKPPRPTLIERFRAAHDPSAALQQQQQQQSSSPLGASSVQPSQTPSPSGYGTLTAKALLERKVELLRRDRPLRLRFFAHVKSLQRQMQREQNELSAVDRSALAAMRRATGGAHNDDGDEEEADGGFSSDGDAYGDGASPPRGGISRRSLPGAGGSGNIAARNILAAQHMTPEGLAEQRRLTAERRDERMAAARERCGNVRQQKHERFVSLVERARGIGYNYDTGLTDPTAAFRFGSEANDRAAQWLIYMALDRSRQCFAARAGKAVAAREAAEAIAAVRALEDRSVRKVQRWWRRAMGLRRVVQHAASIVVVVKYLRAIPKIQCRFRIAMRSLINRVVRLQRHFRAMFTFRRLRYEHARRTIARVAAEEVGRADRDVAVIAKEKKRLEVQLNGAIKGRKQHFQDLVRQQSERMMARMKEKEFLIALSEESVASLADLVMGPKERQHREAIAEYAAQAHLKFLAATNPSRVVELQMGYRPPPGLFSFKEQSLIRKYYALEIPRPHASLVVGHAEAQGIIEERGYALGQADFVAKTMLSGAK